MSNDWVGLDDDMEAPRQTGGGDVQYVGVVEAPDEPEVRAPRRPVQRVSPSARPVQSNGVVAPGGGGSRGGSKESMIFFPTASGAEVALNREAALSMARSKVHAVGGQTGLRIKPGQYLVVVPNSPFAEEAPRRVRGRAAARAAARPVEGLGTTDWAAFTRGLVGGLANLGTGIATAVVSERQSRRDTATERLRIQVEADAAAAARQAGLEEQQRSHNETMARLRQQQAELTALQQGGASSTVAAVSGGASPVVWVVVAIAAIGGIGGLVWYLRSRKKAE